MELKKLVLATAVFGALGGLYGCSGDEDVSITVDDNSVTTTTTTTTTGGDNGSDDGSILELYPFAEFGSEGATSCPETTSLQVSGGFGVCVLPAVIESDITLTADKPWVMEDRVIVGNGDGEMTETDGVLASGDPLLEVTVTIEPGTYVLGSGTNANMVVTRGSKIMAEGTAAAPITFASLDDGFLGVGEWGGLIIHGFGLHNNCSYDEPATACNIDAEGESGLAGGHDNTDDSGVLSYVIVTEAGKEISSGDEINGISFVAVGSGTTVEYIQVNQNLDDGVEFYGGAVSAKYLVLTANGDDSVDWDEGWIGNLQYVLVVQDDAVSGTTVEADTEGSLDFLSEPTVMNATFVGAGSKTTLHVLKASSGGYFHNIVMTGAAGTIGECVQVNGTGAQNNAVDGSIVYNQVVADCTTFEVDSDNVETTFLADNGNAISIFSVEASLDTNYASTAAEASGVAVVTASDFSPVADDAFFDDTTFIGAVNPDGSDLWYEGWIIEGSLP